MKIEKVASCFVVREDTDQILLIMHPKYNVWMPTGGHCEENEMTHETVIRETFEETGIRIDFPLCQIGKNSILPTPIAVSLDNIGTHFHENFVYVAWIPTVEDVAEHEDIIYKWFSMSEALRLEPMWNDVRGYLWMIMKGRG